MRKCFSTLYWPFVISSQLITPPSTVQLTSKGQMVATVKATPSLLQSYPCNSWARSHCHKRREQNPQMPSCHCLFVSPMVAGRFHKHHPEPLACLIRIPPPVTGAASFLHSQILLRAEPYHQPVQSASSASSGGMLVVLRDRLTYMVSLR